MSDSIIILNETETRKKISSIKGRTGTMSVDIQAAVIGGLAHAAEHADSGLLTKLVLAVSAANATQLRKYVAAFSPLKWNAKLQVFKKAKKGGAYRVADAVDVLWDAEIRKAKAEAKGYDGAKARKLLRAKLDELEASALEAGDFGMLAVVQDSLASLAAEAAEAAELAA